MTSRSPPATKGKIVTPLAVMLARKGQDTAPQTSSSTPSSLNRAALCHMGPWAKSSRPSATMRPSSDSTMCTRRATSKTGAILSFQTANAVFMVSRSCSSRRTFKKSIFRARGARRRALHNLLRC